MERVQRAAVRVIMENDFTNYKNGLKCLNLATLDKRRELLCLKFAKNCLKVDKLKKMFPKSSTMHNMSKRNFEFYRVNRTMTERYLNSAVPQMQRLLNSYQEKKIKTWRYSKYF